VCAAGIIPDPFNNGMAGCPGSVTWQSASSLCATSAHVCSAAEWLANFGGQAPTYNFWVSDDLGYNGSGSNSCDVGPADDVSYYACNSPGPSDNPMRVCSPTQNDPIGNHCNWTGCGYGTYTNQYFGGCGGAAPNAGTLCCP
jgi:hypothetical protein